MSDTAQFIEPPQSRVGNGLELVTGGEAATHPVRCRILIMSVPFR